MAEVRVPRPGGGHPRTRPDALSADRAYSCVAYGFTCTDVRSHTASQRRMTRLDTDWPEVPRAAVHPASTAPRTSVAMRSSG
jgi:hypothetical protein